MGLFGFIGGFTKSARKYNKAAYRYEKARGQAALNQVNRAIESREQENPREQAMLKQSMFARGLGKSTIAAQDTARLTANQARAMAALQEQRGLAERGLSLIRKRRKLGRRMAPFEMLDAAASGGFAAWDMVDRINAGKSKKEE